MGSCCAYNQKPRPQRRINGLELPLNFQQVIGWFVFIATALVNSIILIEIQFKELKVISIITFAILYLCHVASHLTAALTDPSERELRKLKVNNVPEFDRSVHAHVIENGRCHLCNIYTSSRSTKHCSLCNKCVDHFDHHCKWLNNCVGQRNYASFITCVTTALLISLFTSSLCVTDIVLFLSYPQKLSASAQNFINCSLHSDTSYNVKYCKNSIVFFTLLIVFCVCALAIACALLHLCCFHVYISLLGVSTYEYIVKSSTSRKSTPKCNYQFCSRKLYIIHKSKEKNNSYQSDNVKGDLGESKVNKSKINIEENGESHANGDQNNRSESKVSNILSVLVANELSKAKKVFINDKNKIHPQHDTEIS